MTKSKDDVVAGVTERFLHTLRDVRALQLHRQGAASWLALDMSMPQLKAVMTLVASGGLPAGELAQSLGVAPSAITPLVDKLCAQDLASREPDARDRRVTWIRPTAEATRLRDRLLTASRELYADLLADLTIKELEGLDKALAILAAGATRRLADEAPSTSRAAGEVRA